MRTDARLENYANNFLLILISHNKITEGTFSNKTLDERTDCQSLVKLKLKIKMLASHQNLYDNYLRMYIF